MTKQISLTQNMFAVVDDNDFEFLNQWKWCANRIGNTAYAVRGEWLGLSQKTILMHRVIMNTPNGMDVDHIDGNGLNNTRGNLRNCTRSQNIRNSGRTINNSSNYKGVHWYKSRNKWRARIEVNGKQIFLGYFSDEKEAAHAYDKAAKEYFGEYARTNF